MLWYIVGGFYCGFLLGTVVYIQFRQAQVLRNQRDIQGLLKAIFRMCDTVQ